MTDEGARNIEPVLESQDLADIERRYIEMGERYYSERQYRVNMATIARRVIIKSHPAAHYGQMETCATCSDDWAFIETGSGVTAPAA